MSNPVRVDHTMEKPTKSKVSVAVDYQHYFSVETSQIRGFSFWANVWTHFSTPKAATAFGSTPASASLNPRNSPQTKSKP